MEKQISLTDRERFLARISRLHDGALVTLRVGARDEVVDQPFRGVSADGEDIVIQTGTYDDHHGHRVPHVDSVRLEQTDEGADAAIAMTTDDGTCTEIRFRSPMRADLLDPAVE
jgi:hypothetical protein